MAYSKEQKSFLSRLFKNVRRLNGGFAADHCDRLAEGLSQRERRRYDQGGESWRDYGFVRLGNGLTDDEIADLFRSMEVRIDSPYDCTGKAFTNRIDWHRNPNGSVSYVHRMSIDI